MLALEFPPGMAPGPVMLSQNVKDNLIIELTGQHPINDDWRRLPTVYLAPERRAGGGLSALDCSIDCHWYFTLAFFNG